MEYRGVEIDGSILKSEKDVDELEKSCLKNVEKENCETIDLWKGLENQNSLDENIEKAMLKNVKETKKMQQEMER